jgi:predicted ATPase
VIENIIIKNFKGIKSLDLKCRGMTLLSGANGSGKSTVLQSLLLLLQTYINPFTATISLNGPYVQLGTAEEIQYTWSSDSTTEFSYSTDSEHLTLSFDVELTDSRDVIESTVKQNVFGASFMDQIKYLSANRIAPAHTFAHSTNEISKKRNLGNFGEFTFSFLSKHGKEQLSIPQLIHSESSDHGVASSLIANVTAWMQKISPGIILEPEILQSIGASKITYGYPGIASPNFSSHNVGFGITNVLPIIVRILMSSPGDILILENPEAHVHPRGQVEIGKLLGLASNNGIQIFLETHSDHIFNGIRLALRDSIQGFANCAMYYATRDVHKNGQFETRFSEITLSEDGNIYEAPQGFFDEWEAAIMELL